MRLFVGLAALPLTFALLGCPVGHQSGPARAQEAATELNVNSRFGRMELAAERVSPAQREAFLERRKSWGANVRVADYELAGFKMKGEADAEMIVKVSWYRIDEGDLRTTLLKQKWHDFKGDWKLVAEARADGDLGLIGEPAPLPTAKASTDPATARRATQFPTIRLGAGEPAPTAEPENKESQEPAVQLTLPASPAPPKK